MTRTRTTQTLESIDINLSPYVERRILQLRRRLLILAALISLVLTVPAAVAMHLHQGDPMLRVLGVLVWAVGSSAVTSGGAKWYFAIELERLDSILRKKLVDHGPRRDQAPT